MRRGTTAVHVLLIIVLGLIIHNNARYGDFVLYDYQLVKESFYIRSFRNLPELFLKSLRSADFHRYATYRPLTQVTYMVDYSFGQSEWVLFFVALPVHMQAVTYVSGCN